MCIGWLVINNGDGVGDGRGDSGREDVGYNGYIRRCDYTAYLSYTSRPLTEFHARRWSSQYYIAIERRPINRYACASFIYASLTLFEGVV